MPVDLRSLRIEIAALARRQKCRRLGHPNRWFPDRVTDPQTGQPFTWPGAWDFIATLMEKGHPIEVMELKDPPGKNGYVMLVDLAPGVPNLYIKLEMLKDTVLGRSFHYSDY